MGAPRAARPSPDPPPLHTSALAGDPPARPQATLVDGAACTLHVATEDMEGKHVTIQLCTLRPAGSSEYVVRVSAWVVMMGVAVVWPR